MRNLAVTQRGKTVVDANFKKQFARSRLARGSALSKKCNSRCAVTPFNIINTDPKWSVSVNVVRHRYFVTDKLPFIYQ